MKILTIGDIVGAKSIDYLSDKLWQIRQGLGAELVIANGENATDIRGISASDIRRVLDCGVDLITLGNHAYGRRDAYDALNDEPRVIRPANYPPGAPGMGYTVLRLGGLRILCINVLGTALMEALACPFDTVDRILQREAGNYDLAILDIHAETTSEKIALARYFDGRIHVIFGTHTHVPTADEQILPNGSGYITDIGMTGPIHSVIGTNPTCVIEKFRTKIPVHFHVAEGDIRACGALFEFNEEAKKITSVKRVKF